MEEYNEETDIHIFEPILSLLVLYLERFVIYFDLSFEVLLLFFDLRLSCPPVVLAKLHRDSGRDSIEVLITGVYPMLEPLIGTSVLQHLDLERTSLLLAKISF